MKLTDEQIQSIEEKLSEYMKHRHNPCDPSKYLIAQFGIIKEFHDKSPDWIAQLLTDRQAWKEEAEQLNMVLVDRLDEIHDLNSEINEVRHRLNQAVELLEMANCDLNSLRIGSFLSSLSQEGG